MKILKDLIDEVNADKERSEKLREEVCNIFIIAGDKPKAAHEMYDVGMEIINAKEPVSLNTMLVDFMVRDLNTFSWRLGLFLIPQDKNFVENTPEWSNFCVNDIEGMDAFYDLSDEEVVELLSVSPSLPLALEINDSLIGELLGSQYLKKGSPDLLKAVIVEMLSLIFYSAHRDSPDVLLMDRPLPTGDSEEDKKLRRAVLFSRLSLYQRLREAQAQFNLDFLERLFTFKVADEDAE